MFSISGLSRAIIIAVPADTVANSPSFSSIHLSLYILMPFEATSFTNGSASLVGARGLFFAKMVNDKKEIMATVVTIKIIKFVLLLGASPLSIDWSNLV